jgi:phosphoribosylformylglycinamidine synthase
MWQFSQAIDGIAEACRALDTPVVSGNVSLYNETEGRGIHPTPMIGMVGLMDDVSKVRGSAFPAADLAVVLLGGAAPVLGGSEYLLLATGTLAGPPPAFDAAQARATIEALLAAHGEGLVLSAHDCSEGGLAVALAECTFGGVGATIAIAGEGRDDVALFGEAQGRVVLATDRPDALVALAAKHGVPAAILGRTGGDRLRVRRADTSLIDAPIAELRRGWATALEEMLR